jgi:hypothetical protein
MAKTVVKFSLKVLSQFTQHRLNHHRVFTADDQLVIQTAGLDSRSIGVGLFKILKASDDLVTLSLSSIQHLNEIGFEIDTKDAQLFKNVIHLLSKSTEFNNELIEGCFSLIRNIFSQHIPKMNHSEYEILFYTLKEQLYIADAVKSPLAFLKQLVETPFVKPEIYDCIPKVFEIFFESYSSFFKETARDIVLQFIKVYPIDETLLLKFVTDLIKNLEHPDNQTRALICDFLTKLFESHGLLSFQSYV